MKLLLIIFTLFSTTRTYDADQTRCDGQSIEVKYEDQWYELQLFNIILKEDVSICPYIEGAVSFRFDSMSNLESDLQAYVYVDGQLLQDQLIEAGVAYVERKNPNYFHVLKEKEEVVEVVATPVEEPYYHSKNIMYILMMTWSIFMISYIVVLKKKN